MIRLKYPFYSSDPRHLLATLKTIALAISPYVSAGYDLDGTKKQDPEGIIGMPVGKFKLSH